MTANEMELVIGLEVHCQLNTASKLFCSCPSGSFGARANLNVCPVCTGQPGTLPVLNRQAVELSFSAALALGCKLRDVSIFARKNYFYPDLPKGYQISQYEEPFSTAGALEIAGPPAKRIGIHRIHMEEDAGKLVHDIGAEELDYSLADYNRAGTPLIEIVSEPEMRSSEEAFQYLTVLKEILQYVGVSHCDMEKGEMRCDANVSVRPRGQQEFGTRAEIKNLNSFRNVKDAIDYEFRRHCELIKEGGKVVQETRLWDANRGVTEPMRSKEEAHDYRYFPEPDLVPLEAEPAMVSRLKSALPELPAAMRARLVSSYKISEYDAGVMTGSRALARYYEDCLKDSGDGAEAAKLAANLISNELLAKLHAEGVGIEKSPVSPAHIASLVALSKNGVLTSKGIKEVFAKVWETREDPAGLVEKLGLAKVSDEGELTKWVEEALSENPKAVTDLRAGKERAIGAIVGTVMKKSRGKADPAVVNRLILEKLK
ncbi:MAG: Asp-tRNA(Asn)/Glu-tRNA(Gln) amidotransferase subunit GatB [Elusimicrobia bacterium]|nr:Asp-tRNA(Asn)/Glu-tRNA(Gln) amidotransferase subunit GatB [Elusimicrobiota bacterium]